MDPTLRDDGGRVKGERIAPVGKELLFSDVYDVPFRFHDWNGRTNAYRSLVGGRYKPPVLFSF